MKALMYPFTNAAYRVKDSVTLYVINILQCHLAIMSTKYLKCWQVIYLLCSILFKVDQCLIASGR